MLKKLFALMMAALLLCAALPAMAEDALTLADINAEDNYLIKLRRVASLTPPDEAATRNYYVQQGATTDGEYAYMIMENQKESLCSIWKVSMETWEVANVAYGLELSHGNCMAYHPERGQLVVVHNKPRYNVISFVDPETLEIVEDVELGFRVFSMAYNPNSDQYVFGLSGGYDFVITDGEFNVIKTCTAQNTGLVTQGVDCDDTYIYFPQCSKDSTVNQLVVYDWEGNYVNTVRVSAFQEIEDIFHVGDKVYIAFNARGSYVYEATLTIKESK